MPSYPSLNDAPLTGKRVLVRIDHNIETDASGQFKTDAKMRSSLPTLQLLLSKGARLILMTHVGRPKGKPNAKLSTKMAAEHLKTLLPGVSITHTTEIVGPNVQNLAANLKDGSILYLENVRFSPAEEGGLAEQEAFGQELASLADVYVNDAFASCHIYEEASTCAVARLLPAYAGLDLLHEHQIFTSVLSKPRAPVTLIISGAKMETKIPVIESFLQKGDDILLGGCIANTFIAAQGIAVGSSKYENDQIDTSKEIIRNAEQQDSATLHIPRDVVVAPAATEDAQVKNVQVDGIQSNMMILDVGERTIEQYCGIIEKSGTIIWNGPLGMYEIPRFAQATKRVAESIAKATTAGAISLIGGGDSLDFHKKYQVPLDAYTYVSTGGGAMLEILTGKDMPAFIALGLH